MEAEKNIIVAFEFGSSAIRGVAGTRDADGNIQILAIEQRRASGIIRRGTVYNINKTTTAITRIKESLNERLDTNITRAYVGIAGQSLHTDSNKVVRNYSEMTTITPELIDSMMDENRTIRIPDREILDVIPQEYKLDTEKTNDPIGVSAERIDGRYLNVIARTSLQDNIRKCMRDAGLEIVDLFTTPIELSKLLLQDRDKSAGCALIDMGAETTTVSFYAKNILRNLVTIPLGGNNITTDIAKAKRMENDEAEDLKLEYGVAMMTSDKNEDSRQLTISNDRSISESEIQKITSARYEEILANVWHHLPKGRWQVEDLVSGIVFTGGAAGVKGLADAFAKIKGFDASKIKVAKEILPTLQCGPDVDKKAKGFNAAIALLMQATENCVGAVQIVEEEPIEDEEPETIQVAAPKPDTTGSGRNNSGSNTNTGTGRGGNSGGSIYGDDEEKKPGLFGRMKDIFGRMVTEDE